MEIIDLDVRLESYGATAGEHGPVKSIEFTGDIPIEVYVLLAEHVGQRCLVSLTFQVEQADAEPEVVLVGGANRQSRLT